MSRVLPIKLIASLVFTLLVAPFARGNPNDFTVREATGTNVFQLASAKGKFVALHFLLKTECPYCIRHTTEYAQKSGTMTNVVQVFLKPDTDAEIKRWASRLAKDAPRVPIYRDADGALAKAYKIPDGYQFHGQSVHYPALVLLDPNGKEVFRYIGMSNTDRYSPEQLAAKVRELTPSSRR